MVSKLIENCKGVTDSFDHTKKRNLWERISKKLSKRRRRKYCRILVHKRGYGPYRALKKIGENTLDYI